VGFLKKPHLQGLLVGLGIPICLFGVSLLIFDEQNGDIQISTFTATAALCALPNLGLFFFALRKNKDVFAHGILSSCILWALFTFGLKLFG